MNRNTRKFIIGIILFLICGITFAFGLMDIIAGTSDIYDWFGLSGIVGMSTGFILIAETI